MARRRGIIKNQSLLPLLDVFTFDKAIRETAIQKIYLICWLIKFCVFILKHANECPDPPCRFCSHLPRNGDVQRIIGKISLLINQCLSPRRTNRTNNPAKYLSITPLRRPLAHHLLPRFLNRNHPRRRSHRYPRRFPPARHRP